MQNQNEKYANHLSGMIQFPTVSSPDDQHTDWKVFKAFHEYLKKTYPLVFTKLEVIPLGHASLLIHWKTKQPKSLPVLLMAHQDVVPAVLPEQWEHPAFAGVIEDGCVWGRGAIDCKCLLQCELDTLEELLEEGFEPDFDIYLSSGHNEEVRCHDDVKGAALAAAYLKKKGVTIGCLFDEGGRVMPGREGNSDEADISLAEKAPNEFKLYKDGAGGHASKPGRGTVLGDIARAMALVEAHPMPYRLTPLIKDNLAALSQFQPPEIAEIYKDPEHHWEELCKLAKKDRVLDAKLHTTFAVTMAEGAPQVNMLPSHAECMMSVRLLQGDTVQSVTSYLENLMPEGVKVEVTYGENPRPAGSTGTKEFQLASHAVKKIYGKQTVIVPSIMLGGTDSRYFSDICKNIFKFSAFREAGNWGEAHQVDEHIPVSALAQPVQFFKTFLKSYGKE